MHAQPICDWSSNSARLEGRAIPLDTAPSRHTAGVNRSILQHHSVQQPKNADSAQLSNSCSHAGSLPLPPHPRVVAARNRSMAEKQHIGAVTQHSEQPLGIVELTTSPASAAAAVCQLKQADEYQLLKAELAEHAGYSMQRPLPSHSMFDGIRAVQVQCSTTNRLHTMLQIPRQQLQQLDSLQQAQLVEALQHTSGMCHPHMLQVYEVFAGPLHLHIVLEECSAGRLLDYPSKQAKAWAMTEEDSTEAAGAAGDSPSLTLEFARWFFQQVVLAVDYYHAKGKTCLGIEQTVLKVVPNLPQPVVKVPTQILAHGVMGLTHTPAQGQSAFTPPELRCAEATIMGAGGAAAEAATAAAVDVWACGVLLLKLLGGHLVRHTNQYQHMSKPGEVFVLPDCIQQVAPVEFLELLQGMLCIDPAGRVKLSDVLSNSWFQQDLTPSAADMTMRYLAKSNPCGQSAADIEAVIRQAAAADMKPTNGMATATAKVPPAEASQGMQHKRGCTCRPNSVCLQHQRMTETVMTQHQHRQQQVQKATHQPSPDLQQLRLQSAADQATALILPQMYKSSSTAANAGRFRTVALLFGGWLAGLVLLHLLHWPSAPQQPSATVLVADAPTEAAAASSEGQDALAAAAAQYMCCCFLAAAAAAT